MHRKGVGDSKGIRGKEKGKLWREVDIQKLEVRTEQWSK